MINGLKKASIEIDRRVLADIAIHDAQGLRHWQKKQNKHWRCLICFKAIFKKPLNAQASLMAFLSPYFKKCLSLLITKIATLMTEITTDKLIQYSENLTDITQDQFSQFIQDAKALISTAQNPQDLQNIRVTLTGKKIIWPPGQNSWADSMPTAKTIGGMLHQVRTQINDSLQQAQSDLENKALAAKLASESIDITLPARGQQAGNLHLSPWPLSVCKGFSVKQGFEVATGPSWATTTTLKR